MKRNLRLEGFTVFVFVIFVGIILYYAFWPFQITTLESINIDKKEYCRGDFVNVNLQFVKYMDIQAKVTWYIVDGIVYQLESPGVTRQVGENDFSTLKQIPLSLLPGKYHLRVEMEYNVHPLHKPIVNTWNTETFTVMPSDKCPNVAPLQTKQIEVQPFNTVEPSQATQQIFQQQAITPTQPAQVGSTEISVTPSKAALKRLIEKVNILNSVQK